jgi:type II secretory ATPase GspE/PulE/Tfp pilus assembly ATPase PilB-like protein
MNKSSGYAGLHVDNLSPEEAVAQMIDEAADLQVSDLFLTTNEGDVTVAVRHLGILRPLASMPLDMGRRVMARIKAMAGMDVAERRQPLDGRWIHQSKGGGQIDLRISTLPTLYGEDFTLRLLPRVSQYLALEGLGLARGDFNRLTHWLSSPGGLILVTGPSGSGKTTTLYACLRHLNNGERKINTIEDPIEYAVPGIRQSQVNPKLEVGFPELLRGVLRQSPDVIMVGEIRDPVTAETAVRAANSGHLVLATLHAPIAAGAIQSMLSLGVHPHFLGSALLGAISQRLIRTLCSGCKSAFDLSDAPNTYDEVRPLLESGQGQLLYGPEGCEECHRTGYSGRTGVFELLPASKDIRELIAQRAPIQQVRQKAGAEGMIEFRQSALLKVARGETSIEEITRILPSEYLEQEG